MTPNFLVNLKLSHLRNIVPSSRRSSRSQLTPPLARPSRLPPGPEPHQEGFQDRGCADTKGQKGPGLLPLFLSSEPSSRTNTTTCSSSAGCVCASSARIGSSWSFAKSPTEKNGAGTSTRGRTRPRPRPRTCVDTLRISGIKGRAAAGLAQKESGEPPPQDACRVESA